MGIWDDDGYANDEALDWITRLDPAEGLQPVRQLMHATLAASEPALDMRQSGHLLAAVELVAAAVGQPHPAIPEAARRWCAAQGETPDDDLRILATRALDFVGTASAFSELWSQRADDAAWRRELDDLRMRLTPPRVDGEPIREAASRAE